MGTTAQQWRFRTAVPADVAAVVRLVESAYRGDSSRVGWTTEADLLAGQRTDAREVADAVTDAGGVLTVAVDDEENLLGCCRLQWRRAVAYFGTFAVRPDLQGSGLGGALLAEGERRAAARGARTVEMTVIARRRDLIAWYERRGYSATGERRPFPYGDERFGVPLVDDLDFVVLSKALPST